MKGLDATPMIPMVPYSISKPSPHEISSDWVELAPLWTPSSVNQEASGWASVPVQVAGQATHTRTDNGWWSGGCLRLGATTPLADCWLIESNGSWAEKGASRRWPLEQWKLIEVRDGDQRSTDQIRADDRQGRSRGALLVIGRYGWHKRYKCQLPVARVVSCESGDSFRAGGTRCTFVWLLYWSNRWQWTVPEIFPTDHR